MPSGVSLLRTVGLLHPHVGLPGHPRPQQVLRVLPLSKVIFTAMRWTIFT
jgi:hypothetical protein